MRHQQLAFLTSIVIALFCFTPSVIAQTQSPPVFGPQLFTRDSGKPQTISRDFFVQDPTASYALIIRSGQNGAGRVTSVAIRVNGIDVARPSDFNPQTGLLVRSVKLTQQNTISVELRGEPDAFITVTIQKGPAPSQVIVVDNKTDPLLLEVIDTDANTIDYFGERDSEGLPTFIYAVRVKSATGDVTTYFFDEQGRPIRIVAPNGVFFEITWQSNTAIAITSTAPNGDQVDIPFDFGTQTSAHPLTTLINGEKPTSAYHRNHVLVLPKTLPAISQSINQGQSTSLVTVRHCNEAVNNATVELDVRPERGEAQSYIYKGIGNGVYSVTIPNRDTGGDRQPGNRLCFALTNVLRRFCEGLEAIRPLERAAICPSLSVAALFLGVPPFVFIPACEVVMFDLELICPGNELIGELICEGNRVVTNRIVRGRLSLNVTARMPGAAFPQFDFLGTPVNGQYPPVTINFPCSCDAGYGKRFVINDNNTNVKIRILPFEADFTDEIWLFNGGRTFFIGTNRQVGEVFDLGSFSAGTELVFGIRVRETGQTFRMGPGFRNPDRYAHDKVVCLQDGVKVSFEDNLGLGDKDFDDAVFKITTSH
ncbi:MAG: hypothetical protein QOF62_2799 [Pyrinomonadaceae bacterium]|jgi:hypothetical protein|nr:hypothetical protein [Pyrinomonadaceae bacterium]